MYNDDDDFNTDDNDNNESFWAPPDSEVPDDYQIAVARLSRDLRDASETLSETEARYLVRAYYNLQDQRIRASHQVRKLTEFNQPHVVISWLGEQSRTLEDQIRAALDRYSLTHRYALWPRSIAGIGPVIAAGLISHTHIEYLHTAGHLWSFAGLNPKRRWVGRADAEKIVSAIMKQRNENRQVSDDSLIEIADTINTRPELLINLLTNRDTGVIDKRRASVVAAVAKRPWNADLKKLCWKIGESFVKVQSNKNDFYGKIYKYQKAMYVKKNDNGGFVDNAQLALSSKNWDHSTDAYKAYSCGKLPPAHIHAMARRYAVKMFLAHYWEAAWSIDHPGKQPVLPYPIVHMGHAHVVEMPHKHLVAEAIAREEQRARVAEAVRRAADKARKESDILDEDPLVASPASPSKNGRKRRRPDQPPPAPPGDDC